MRERIMLRYRSSRVKREVGDELEWNKIILVIGPARSGTTFVGKVFSFANGVDYLFEPDVVSRNPSPWGSSVEDLFKTIPWFNGDKLAQEGAYRDLCLHLAHLVRSRFGKRSDVLVVKIPRPDHVRGLSIGLCADHVVFVRRHPLGIANSYDKNNRFRDQSVQDLVRHQTKNLADQLRRKDIVRVVNDGMDSWKTLVLGLGLLYENLEMLLDGLPVTVLDYEIACTDYLNSFRVLFDECDLEWNDKVKKMVIDIAEPEKEVDAFHSYRKRSIFRKDAWIRELAPWQIRSGIEVLQEYRVAENETVQPILGKTTRMDSLVGTWRFFARRGGRVIGAARRTIASLVHNRRHRLS